MRKTKAEINEEIFRAKGALDMLMCHLGLEVDPNSGSIYFIDEDTDRMVDMYIDGLKCIYPFLRTDEPRPIQRGEIEFNPYFNTKLMLNIVEWYFAEHGYLVTMQKITNARPDNIGHIEIEFANGVVYKSDAYYKDSLKYIDILMKLEQAPPIEFERLRRYDIKL